MPGPAGRGQKTRFCLAPPFPGVWPLLSGISRGPSGPVPYVLGQQASHPGIWSMAVASWASSLSGIPASGPPLSSQRGKQRFQLEGNVPFHLGQEEDCCLSLLVGDLLCPVPPARTEQPGTGPMATAGRQVDQAG